MRLFAAFILAVFALCVNARTITDHMERKVEIPDHIERVVVTNLFPFASLAAIFIGEPQKIVGMHEVSMTAAKSGLLAEIYPGITKASVSFMKGNALNIESLIALRPDVVFCKAGDAATLKMLENARIPAITVSTNQWNYDVLKTYEAWMNLLGEVFPDKDISQKARTVAERISTLVKDRVANLSTKERKRVLFLFQDDPKRIVTSGRRFFGQYWAEAAGASNVAEDIKAENSNAQINMEQIYAWNPDVILITNFTNTLPQDLYQNKNADWSGLQAIKDKAVYKMPLGLYRSFTPSADSPLTLLWIAKTLYPARFKDIDLTKETKNYYKSLFNVELTDEQAQSMFTPKSGAAKGVKAVLTK